VIIAGVRSAKCLIVDPADEPRESVSGAELLSA
jgi:hypothetical protein